MRQKAFHTRRKRNVIIGTPLGIGTASYEIIKVLKDKIERDFVWLIKVQNSIALSQKKFRIVFSKLKD